MSGNKLSYHSKVRSVNIMKTPCYKCLMVPVCKGKEYLDLMECHIIKDILYRDKNKRQPSKADRTAEFHTTILDTIEVLKPTLWYYERHIEWNPPGTYIPSIRKFP